MSEINTIDASEQTGVLPTAEVKQADTTPSTPQVEVKDGKIYVDGNRVYDRNELSKIAADSAQKAKQDAIKSIYKELEVEDLGSVKDVIKQIRNSGTEGNNTLTIEQLKDTVKVRQQTLEELTSKVSFLEKELVLKEHMGNIKAAMPTNLTQLQKETVVDIMNYKNMLQTEGNQFAIRNGENFFTTDGETPDYKSAVEFVIKNYMGLPTSKQGVEIPSMERGLRDGAGDSNKMYDPNNKDVTLRRAYVQLMSQPANATKKFTESEVRNHAKSMSSHIGIGLQGSEALRGLVTQSAKK